MAKKKKILILTGGGDCPGLNAVIRAVSKAARQHGGYELWGSIEAYNGILKDPPEVVKLNRSRTAGIHVKGGTIIKTTNRGNPLAFPVRQKDGSWTTVDRSGELIEKINRHGFHAVISVGGDGSQRISQKLYEKGLNIVGVPKTIDNDLYATDFTFGFSTAVHVATESLDRLVTTAESHYRVMIMEVMGRDAGWIALHTAIAGGAEVCLLPEIPFDIKVILKKIKKRYHKGRGFVNIVVAEGARPIGGRVVGTAPKSAGDEHIKLGGIGIYLRQQLEQMGCPAQIRTTILGHTQRGGTPIAFDRILAAAMGVKAFELILEGAFGQMVSYKNNRMQSVPLKEAISKYKVLQLDSYLVDTARRLGISFGDKVKP
ncbi:MAG TPA: ATP-dependent 6-phosphofructokinase [Bacteroidetes bacterium]|nr:ATP-dependent 6-phosphofructokinase [Bacteroidota bacterium]